ncbi:type II toxin-antitoxin system RelB/DinJ family antitoxin [Desulfovibrio sp. OttesenSCG-928-A18]|nr:type II toxin-antitoxin system RelB/DinJ family antitoxin [Desulfovibrio sp. OttesenSCG-928-A18]
MKADAAAILASYGLNLSDAVRMLLARITMEKRLPAGLIMNEDEYDARFRSSLFTDPGTGRKIDARRCLPMPARGRRGFLAVWICRSGALCRCDIRRCGRRSA